MLCPNSVDIIAFSVYMIFFVISEWTRLPRDVRGFVRLFFRFSFPSSDLVISDRCSFFIPFLVSPLKRKRQHLSLEDSQGRNVWFVCFVSPKVMQNRYLCRSEVKTLFD